MTFQGNLTENVYLYVRDKILKGELPFGTSLSRRALAEEVGASIVPVGDALQRLENDGLVESRPRVGTRVRIPTMKSIRGHYILREALETQAARIFTGKASPEERDEVRRMAADLDRMNAEAGGDGAQLDRQRLFTIHLLHMRFHMRIAECSGCDELCQAIEKNQILVFNWLYDIALGNEAPPPGWHGELTQVLLDGDADAADAADAAMRRHVRYRMDDVLARLEPNLQFSEARLAVFSRRPRRKKNAGKKTIAGGK